MSRSYRRGKESGFRRAIPDKDCGFPHFPKGVTREDRKIQATRPLRRIVRLYERKIIKGADPEEILAPPRKLRAPYHW